MLVLIYCLQLLLNEKLDFI